MEGAALIMLRYSSPVQQYSTALGRSLFEWDCGFEDLFCVLAAYESRLPPQWRFENIRTRAIIAEVEYKYLSPSERKPRILDDVWGHMYASAPQLRKIIAWTTGLKKLHGQAKQEHATELKALLPDVDQTLAKFLESLLALEVLETVQSQSEYYSDQHSTCCPFLPLEPLVFQFPPAGIFQDCYALYEKPIYDPSYSRLCAPKWTPIRTVLGWKAKVSKSCLWNSVGHSMVTNPAPRSSGDHYSLPSPNDDCGVGLYTVSADMGVL
jgi:hypothetical protein